MLCLTWTCLSSIALLLNIFLPSGHNLHTHRYTQYLLQECLTHIKINITLFTDGLSSDFLNGKIKNVFTKQDQLTCPTQLQEFYFSKLHIVRCRFPNEFKRLQEFECLKRQPSWKQSHIGCGILTGSGCHDSWLCVCLWCDAVDWKLWWRSSHICYKETSSKSTQHKHTQVYEWI